MNAQELEQTLVELLARIAPEIEPEAIDRDEPLQQALDIDSFDYLNFLVAVRDKLGVSIAEADYDKLSTLSDMVRFLLPKV